MKILKKSAPFLGVALFWLLLWQLAAWKTGTALLLPSPLETLTRLWELAHTAEFFKITALTSVGNKGAVTLLDECGISF